MPEENLCCPGCQHEVNVSEHTPVPGDILCCQTCRMVSTYTAHPDGRSGGYMAEVTDPLIAGMISHFQNHLDEVRRRVNELNMEAMMNPQPRTEIH